MSLGQSCAFAHSCLGQVPSDAPESPMGKKKKDSKKEQKKLSISIPGGKAGSRKSLGSVNSPKEPKPEEFKPE